MRKDQIVVGGHYKASVSGRVVTVRVDRIMDQTNWKGTAATTYAVTNLSTGRELKFRSAMKFRSEVTKAQMACPVQDRFPECGKYAPCPHVNPAPNKSMWDSKTDPLAKGVVEAKDERDRVDPLDTVTAEDVPATDHDLDLHAATEGKQSLPPTTTGPTTVSVPTAPPSPAVAATRSSTPGSGVNARLAARKAAPAGNRPPHVIVEARAGTGKTTTMIEALKVLRGIPTTLIPSPQQRAVYDAVVLSRDEARSVGVVAFNKTIAAELQQRVPAGVDACTMHSLGFKAVRAAYGSVRVEEHRVKDIIAELTGLDVKTLWREKPVVLKAVDALVEKAKMNLTDCTDPANVRDLADYYDIETSEEGRDRYGKKRSGRDWSAEIFDLVPRVLERCRDVVRDGCVDFNDMVWIVVVNDLPVRKYDLFMVDECQDLNRTTQALAKKAGDRLVFVGDPRQAVYGFAGADCDSMPRLQKELEATDRGVVRLPLTVTRRCAKAVVAEAAKIVPDFSAHESNPEGLVSYGVMEADDQTLLYTQACRDGDLVLCRCNAPLIKEAFRFIRAGRKATVAGRDIGQGLINTVRKTGAETAADLLAKMNIWLEKETAKERAKKHPSESKLMGLQDRYDCIACLTDGCETADEVVRKIESVFTDDKKSPGIKLSSVHKSKGTEALRVFLLQPKKSEVIPDWVKPGWELDQLTNLLYVAITRAKTELVFVS